MAINWLKEVIDNKDLKDDAVVTLAGGQTVQIGEIRALTKANQKLLSDKEAAVAAREADLAKNLETLQLAQAETAKLFTQLQNDKNKVNDNQRVNNDPDPLELLERDPVIGPLAKALRAQNDIIKKFDERDAATRKIQTDMATAYVSSRIEDMYERVVPEAKKATLSLEAILKVANDNNIKDRFGIPDIRRAYQQMSTKPMTQEDIDAQIKAAREEGRKEAVEAARLRVPRPGIGSSTGRPESAFKPNISDGTTVSSALSEAIAAAAKDADIWANVDTSLIQ